MDAPLTSMTTRELILALSQIRDALRESKAGEGSVHASTRLGAPTFAEDIFALVAREQRIVHELRRRKRVTAKFGQGFAR